MRPVEIRIPGEFWDSFIYNGRLYLFTLDGDIRTYNWERLVQSMPIDPDYRPLFRQFLTRGQEWYSPLLQRILESPEICKTVASLTNKISGRVYEVASQYLVSAVQETYPSPSHPHTDIEGFYNVLYLSSLDGIYAASLARKLARGFLRVTDVPALRVACSWGSMAVAAGSEGMYDHDLADFRDWNLTEPKQLSNKYCSACSWTSFDVVGSSGPRDAGVIAAFSKPKKDEAESRFRLTTTTRRHIQTIDSDAIFSSNEGLLFGAQDVLVMASRQRLDIDGYDPRRRDETARVLDFQMALFDEKSLPVGELTDDAIGGAATVYGILVEMDRALLLRGVDGTVSAFGQPVNWRTFPRSQNYLNQLHVTYDDHVSIFAFPDDYFIAAGMRGPAAHRPWSRPAY
jgi:hypothetical protein